LSGKTMTPHYDK